MKSKKPFRMHLYKLVTGEKSKTLDEVIRLAMMMPLESRTRNVGSQSYRLEEVFEPTEKEQYWILDFTKFRFEGGPGKASVLTPVESFAMKGGYAFAEETAVLYDHINGWLVVQYNHNGPRSQAISDYLSSFDIQSPNEFIFRIQLNIGAQARLANKKFFTKLHIRVAPDRLSKSYREANVSLVTALESQTKAFGGDIVTVEVGLERDSNKSLQIKKWIPSFLTMVDQEPDAVTSLTISGKDDLEYNIDPVDLISERLELVIKDLPLDDGLRYPQEARYNALKRAYNGWVKDGVIVA